MTPLPPETIMSHLRISLPKLHILSRAFHAGGRRMCWSGACCCCDLPVTSRAIIHCGCYAAAETQRAVPHTCHVQRDQRWPALSLTAPGFHSKRCVQNVRLLALQALPAPPRRYEAESTRPHAPRRCHQGPPPARQVGWDISTFTSTIIWDVSISLWGLVCFFFFLLSFLSILLSIYLYPHSHSRCEL